MSDLVYYSEIIVIILTAFVYMCVVKLFKFNFDLLKIKNIFGMKTIPYIL